MTCWMKSAVHCSIRARLWPALRSPRMRAHINGVRVSETRPEARIATIMVIENSWKMRPSNPGKNTNGMKTAASEGVVDQEPDGESQRHQRQIIDRESEHAHHCERQQQREWQRDRRNERVGGAS